MECKIKNQQGYLLMLAVILIIIVTFAGTLLASMFMGKTRATKNNQQSNAALYIATSGLEIAKHEIAFKYKSCAEYNNNATRFDGAFEVTGKTYSIANNLQGTITDSSIPLSSSSGFADNGIVSIDNELITYVGISGDTLLNTTRGALGTKEADHNLSARVVQNQCDLTTTGGVPSITSPDGKRTIEQPLLGFVGFSSGGKIPIIVSASEAPNLFGYFFNVPAEKVKVAVGGSRIIANLAELNGLTNSIIWITGKGGKIDASGNDAATVGTISNPAILIVDGDITFIDKSNLTVYGILYVTGSITTAVGTNITVQGQIATNGKINLNGDKNITSDVAILSKLGMLNQSNEDIIKITYSGNNAGTLQEIFI